MDFRIGSILVLVVLLLFSAWMPASAMSKRSEVRNCQATPEDEMGPFYRPGAPLRDKIGSGYQLHGQVLAAEDCRPLAAAAIEVWQAGPDGRYADAYRATLIADRKGRYELETTAPPPYVSRPPHIHIRVTADGFLPLVTQHYLQPGETQARFDLVLIAEDR